MLDVSHTTDNVTDLGRIALLEADPDLAAHVDARESELIRRALVVPVVDLVPGLLLRSDLVAHGERAFAAIVVSGLLTRDLDIGGQPALELHGPGELFGLRELVPGMMPAGDSWHAAAPSQVAILDDRLLRAVRRWPRLLTGIIERMCDQRERLALQLVISQQPRVEDRLLHLFWHLSDRFGQATADGIVVSLALTHEALGRLVGARRPTVTLALRALSERGTVIRRADRSWLVTVWPHERVSSAGLHLPAGRQEPVAPGKDFAATA